MTEHVECSYVCLSDFFLGKTKISGLYRDADVYIYMLSITIS